MRIEQSPFKGWFTSFGGSTADSVAGRLRTGGRIENGENVSRYDVLKWNRNGFTSAEEAMAAAKFKQKSLALYQEALGSDFVVPTQFVVGNKKDQNGMKYKVYQVQQLLEGWNAKDAPDDVRNEAAVSSQWEVLSERLYRLYYVASQINKACDDPLEAFPITMTVGDSRQKALIIESSSVLPATKNIMITYDLRLQLFDFGEYAQWHGGMQGSYERILREVRLPREQAVYANQ